jgi:hypothetical protein
MKDALEWIGHPDRRDRTWSDVSLVNGVKALLFAYPSRALEVAPELAGLIAGLDATADPDGARFEACAQHVVRSLRGIGGELSNEVRVFVLAKPDGFRTKVSHSGRYSAEWLIRSADAWQQDAKNVVHPD